jgi:hypothetical protein
MMDGDSRAPAVAVFVLWNGKPPGASVNSTIHGDPGGQTHGFPLSLMHGGGVWALSAMQVVAATKANSFML